MTHTWDISVFYHRCPKCGFIEESRGMWNEKKGKWVKELICTRCQTAFTDQKPRQRPLDWLWEDAAD